MIFHNVAPPAVARALVPNVWDAVALVFVIAALAILEVHYREAGQGNLGAEDFGGRP